MEISQSSLEQEQVQLGVNRYRRQVAKAKEKGREASTGSGKNLLKRMLNPVADTISTYIEEATGRPGRSPAALEQLKLLEPTTLAFIVCRVLVDQISQRMKLTNIQLRIGQRVEDEIRFRGFEEEGGEAYRTMMGKAQKSGDYRYKHRILTHAMIQTEGVAAWENWTPTLRLHVGTRLVDLMIEATGLFDIGMEQISATKSARFITAKPEVLEAIRTADSRCELMQPWLMPMVEPPMAWTSPFSGGYHTQALTLVKTHHREWLEQLQWADMPEVYEGINALQATGWRINRDVYQVAKELWDSRSELAGLPSQIDTPLPPKPIDIETDDDVRRVWKKQAKLTHMSNARRASKTVGSSTILWLAQKFEEAPAIWFPHSLDWRGRMYPASSYLQPQGTDLAKGLLEFSMAKPLKTQDAADWLAIHGANVWGEDKCSFDVRLAWVRDNEERIKRVAQDPLDELWWTEADKPFCFLAWCLEWAGYLEEGLSFCTRIAIAMDGSCNGLQHLSASIKDEVGGRAVNLTPTDEPQDLYQTVADRVEAYVRTDLETNLPGAATWLNSGLLGRKCVKRQCMTRPYGATRMGMQRMLVEHIVDVQEAKHRTILDDPFEASMYLTKHVWESINECVRGAQGAMRYLQSLASACSADKIPVAWTTPVGFPVLQKYQELKSVQVKTQIAGKIVRPRLNVETEKLDARKQRAGVAPNWVHSMDASHLMRSICRARYEREGMSFAMVHDSYGTHASDAPHLARVLREVFVELYEVDQLQALADQITPALTKKGLKKVGEPPAKGTLDISQVTEALYFFA